MNALLIEPRSKNFITTKKTADANKLRGRSMAEPQTRILYVDDDDEIRGLGQEVLERNGYQVDTAADGREGLEALLEGDHQLLITDHKMPYLTGIELVIKARSAGLHLPIVMTSGFTNLSQMPSQIRSEITMLLPKPFATADLLSNVVRILNHDMSNGPAVGGRAPNSIAKTFYDDQNYRHWGINE